MGSFAYTIRGVFNGSILLSRRNKDADESKKLVPREFPRIAHTN
jgi:hypothetical protein